MIIELAEKKIITIVKQNLEILKKSQDENIQKVIKDLENAINDYDTAVESLHPETKDPNEETQVEKQNEPQSVTEEKIETQEVTSVDATKETKEETKTVNIADVQLSMQVAQKLKEAAIELNNKEKEVSSLAMELKAKTDIIEGYKNKFVELNNEIEVFKKEVSSFKQKEQLELAKHKESIIKDLLELYSNLNMSKTTQELELFGLSQLLELRKALEVTVERKNTPVRQTTNSSTIKIVKQLQKDTPPKETFEGLFGKNPEFY